MTDPHTSPIEQALTAALTSVNMTPDDAEPHALAPIDLAPIDVARAGLVGRIDLSDANLSGGDGEGGQ